MLKVIWILVFILLTYFSVPVVEAAKKQPQIKADMEQQTVYPPLEKMLGAMLMFGFRGLQFDENDSFYQLLRTGKIANVILFDRDVTKGGSRNIESPGQLRKLCSQLRDAGVLFIGIDQEGGQVRRLKPKNGFAELPSAQAMGQGNQHETLDKGEKLGQELRNIGLNVDFAPVVDVDVNPYNPVIGRLGRAFSSDPAQVAIHALAFGRGLARSGVIPVLKHFPGQGCADKDSHLEVTDITACWKADVDLLPYAEIFQQGWPGMVMTGHLMQKNLDPQNSATLSHNIIDGLLREGLGWQGVVISDDMQMEAAGGKDLKETMRLAILAGVDILLFGNNLKWDEELPEKAVAALASLVSENSIPETRIRQSWDRISALASVYRLLPAMQHDNLQIEAAASGKNEGSNVKNID